MLFEVLAKLLWKILAWLLICILQNLCLLMVKYSHAFLNYGLTLTCTTGHVLQGNFQEKQQFNLFKMLKEKKINSLFIWCYLWSEFFIWQCMSLTKHAKLMFNCHNLDVTLHWGKKKPLLKQSPTFRFHQV